MVSRRRSIEIHRYLESEELKFLGLGSRKCFAYAARQLHTQDNVILLCSVYGVTNKLADICSIFSDEFSSNFDDPSADITTSSLSCDFSQPALGVPSQSNVTIDVATVRQMLANLRESAVGPDGIPGIFYKRLAFWLASLLAMVYQLSIRQARITDDWRQAKVIPLFKDKRDKRNPSNYRPISLTVITCKNNTIESIIVT